MCFRKKKEVEGDSVDLYVQIRQTGEKKGGDIIPGDMPVPTSDTLSWEFYEAEDGRQWCATRIKTKFFFIIPFTYAEYVIDLGIRRYEKFTAEDAVHEIDEADHWNQRGKMSPVFSEGCVHFHEIYYGNTYDYDYKIGDSDYSYLKYYG